MLTGPPEDSTRASNLMQEAFYNGWNRIHGLMWQTFDFPKGITANMWRLLLLKTQVPDASPK